MIGIRVWILWYACQPGKSTTLPRYTAPIWRLWLQYSVSNQVFWYDSLVALVDSDNTAYGWYRQRPIEPIGFDWSHTLPIFAQQKHRVMTETTSRKPGKKTFQMVAENLSRDIVEGQYRPGDPLPPERELMAIYKVGRPAVREALLELRRNGLIAITNGRRARVMEPGFETIFDGLSGVVDAVLESGDSLRHLFDTRAFIECGLARRAALDANKRDLEELRAALAQSESAVGDRARYEMADIEFHRVLFSIPGNPVFMAIHRAFNSWLLDRWRKLDRTLDRDRESHEGHQKIFDAILMRDPDGAHAAMHEHLYSAWEIWKVKLRDDIPDA